MKQSVLNKRFKLIGFFMLSITLQIDRNIFFEILLNAILNLHVLLPSNLKFTAEALCEENKSPCDFGLQCIEPSLFCDGEVQCKSFNDELNCCKLFQNRFSSTFKMQISQTASSNVAISGTVTLF